MDNLDTPKLNNPPIVEAVLDIECDMPVALDLAALEAPAREAFGSVYPKFQTRFAQPFMVEMPAGETARMSMGHPGLQSLQFLQEDDRQLVQVRSQGYSFNRLAPYGSLDDYLPEIERTWLLFVGLVQPVKVRAVQLRYINRLLLPLTDGRIDLDEYLVHGPKLPVEDGFTFTGFVQQHAAHELATGHQVHVVLAAEPPADGKLPVLFDIQTSHVGDIEPSGWDQIMSMIQSMRRLKNLMFRKSLTEKCLNLFQQ